MTNFVSGWFGLRKDLCQFLLGVCPLLQEYANISYSIPHQHHQPRNPQVEDGVGNPADNLNNVSISSTSTVITNEKKDVIASSRRLDHRVVVPALSLEVPD